MDDRGIPEGIREEAQDRDQEHYDRRDSFLVALLGSGRGAGLELRRKAAEALEDEGYRAIVMEDYDGPRGQPLLKKWEQIVHEEEPDAYFIYVPEGGSTEGFHYEVGYLHGVFGPKQTAQMIHFFLEVGVSTPSVLSGYIEELMGRGRVGVTLYDDEAQACRRTVRRADNRLWELQSGASG